MDLIGNIKERQNLAFEWPIWKVAQASDGLFRCQRPLPNGLWLQSVLTIDCFAKPNCWHCAVGFLRKPAKLTSPANSDVIHRQMIELEAMPVIQWQREEKMLAMSAARSLLSEVGDLQSLSWMHAEYFQMTFQAWRKLSSDEQQNINSKMSELKVSQQLVLSQQSFSLH